MPATTPAQQRLMGQAYAVKTGKLDPKDLDPKYRDQIVDLADSMSKKDLEHFAKTKYSEMKKENIEEMSHIPSFNDFINENEENELNENAKKYGNDVFMSLHNLATMQDIQKDSDAKKELGEIIETFSKFKSKYL